MKTMLDILKERLPEGLEIVKVKDRSNASQIQVFFSYEGEESTNWISKTCAPGWEEKLCDRTIASTMLGYALDRKDLAMADYWKDKMLNG
ncbi:MAG: hypothetical protein IJV91_02140 [Kiritimatiellae bacterium]|nr:hypothetical protein [Kiritimatiellia bacterium]